MVSASSKRLPARSLNPAHLLYEIRFLMSSVGQICSLILSLSEETCFHGGEDHLLLRELVFDRKLVGLRVKWVATATRLETL